MAHRYEGRAYVRPQDGGVVLLDTEGEPGIHLWISELLEQEGYPSYSEARVTITVDIEPSQRGPADDSAESAAEPGEPSS